MAIFNKFGIDFWFKYTVLFSDSTCDEKLNLNKCVTDTLKELGLESTKIDGI